MKRVWLIVLSFVLLCSSVSANPTEDKILDAISLYKKGDYQECIKNLDTIISQDSSYPIAYYYLGLCYAKTNQKTLAIKNYDKVIQTTKDKSLKSMAKTAKDCLGTSGFTSLDAQLSISNDSRAEEFLPGVKKETPIVEKKEPKAKYTEPKPTVSKTPTDAEIGAAIMTLKRAGIIKGDGLGLSAQTSNASQASNQDAMMKLYMQQMTQQANNPAYLMMNMNGNNNNGGMNGMMNMLPFMLNNQGGSNSASNQQLIQTMMMSQMMPNLDFSSSNDKNY